MTNPKSGLGLIILARAEQIEKHKHTIARDSRYISQDVFQRAAVAIIHSNPNEWPEHDIPIAVFYKIRNKRRQDQLAHAAAFLAAEIDYIDFTTEAHIGASIAAEVAQQAEHEIALTAEFISWNYGETHSGMRIPHPIPLYASGTSTPPKGTAVVNEIESEEVTPLLWVEAFADCAILAQGKALYPHTPSGAVDFVKLHTNSLNQRAYATTIADLEEAINNADMLKVSIDRIYEVSLAATLTRLGDMIMRTNTGRDRELLTDINIHLQYMQKVIADQAKADNTVKSESVQDLYATYCNSKIESDKTFADWLIDCDYIVGIPAVRRKG